MRRAILLAFGLLLAAVGAGRAQIQSGPLAARLPLGAAITATTTLVGGASPTWQNYAWQLNPVDCTAPCTITLSNAADATTPVPAGTAFYFASGGPFVPKFSASTSVLYGVPLDESGNYQMGSQHENIVVFSDGTNYLVMPSLNPDFLQSPYIPPASGNLVTQPDFASGWTAVHGTLTAASQWSVESGFTGSAIQEDATSNQHAVDITTASQSPGTFTLSAFCSTLNTASGTNRDCDLEVLDSGSSSRASVVYDPLTLMQVKAPATGGDFNTPSATVTRWGPNRVKITLTWTLSTESTAFKPLMYLYNPARCSAANCTYTGDGASGLIVSDVCLIAGSSPC
jgi:hypothetical protein